MQQITLNENSTIKVVNAKNENFTIYLNYNSTRQGWFLDLESENFNLYGIKITSVLNVLRQWKDKLGFGLYIETENNSEPFFLEDFNTGRSKIYLLEPDDLLVMEEVYAQIQ